MRGSVITASFSGKGLLTGVGAQPEKTSREAERIIMAAHGSWTYFKFKRLFI